MEKLITYLNLNALFVWRSFFIRCCILFFIGALSAFFWVLQSPYWMATLIFIPILWASLPKRSYSYSFVMGHALCQILLFFPSANNYFGVGSYSQVLMLVIWVVLIISPWLILYIPNRFSHFWIMPAMILLFFISLFPPIGVVMVRSPFISAALFFPGLGITGIVFQIILIILASLIFRTLFIGRFLQYKRSNYLCIFFIMGLMIISIISNLLYRTPSPPKGWIAINTHIAFNQISKINKIREHIDQYSKSNYRVVVLPESIIGTKISPSIAMSWYKSVSTWVHGNTIFIIGGGSFEFGKKKNEGYYLIGKGNKKFFYKRQPMLVTEWNPLHKNSQSSNWLSKGVLKIDNIPTLISVCYEGSILWTNIYPFLNSPKPRVYVSIENLNWADGIIFNTQKNTVFCWARLFNVPLIRAVNYNDSFY